MSYYKHHIFFCLNHRDGGREHCSGKNAEAMQAYAKGCVKDLGLSGPGEVRVNKAGCLDRCAGGPIVVVYPEGTWYSYVDTADIDEIVESHLKNGVVVDRLLTAPEVGR